MFRRGRSLGVGGGVLLALLVALAPSSPALALAPVVTTAPPPGAVVGVPAGATADLELAGSDDAGSPISVTATVAGVPQELCSTTVLPDESWSCTLVDPPDLEGPVTVSNGMDQTVVTFGVLHAPVIDGDPGDGGVLTSTMTADDPEQSVTGTGYPGGLLTLSVDGVSGCTTTVAADGRWSCTLVGVPSSATPVLVAALAFASAPDQPVPSAPVLLDLDAAPVVPEPPVSVPEPGVEPVPEVPSPSPPPAEPVPTAPRPDVVPAPAVVTAPAAEPQPMAGPSVQPGPDAAREAAADTDTDTDTDAADTVLAGTDQPRGDDSRGLAPSGTPPVSPREFAGGPTPREDTTARRAASASPSSGADRVPGFGESLSTPSAVLGRSPAEMASGLLTTAALVLLVILPGGLLESTLAANRDRVLRSLRDSAAGRFARAGSRASAHPSAPRRWWGVAAVLLVGAAVSTAVAPQSAAAGGAAPLFAAFLVATATGCLVPATVAVLATVRGGAPHGAVAAHGWLLPLTLITVLASRAADLAPGFVFGLVVGIALRRRAPSGTAVRAVVASTATTLGLGLAAWLASGALRAGVTAVPASGPLAWLLDVLAAVTVGALTAPLVSLLPLRFLDGHELLRERPASWSAGAVLSVLLFATIVAPAGGSWSAVTGDVAVWCTIGAVVTAISLTVWAWFRFVPERARGPARRPVKPASPADPTPDASAPVSFRWRPGRGG